MPTTFVAVDVETTGLDPDRNALIEVAAVAFQDGEIVDTYSSLVNPYESIPDGITRLTGITQAMVDAAPGIFQVKSGLRQVIGQHVVVGHNVGFDLGFLNREQIALSNQRLDTVTLASILLPQAGRFGLESLALYLDLPLPPEGQDHRALADAQLTVALFQALHDRAAALDGSLLNEIVQSGRSIGWPETIFFEEILAQQARQAFTDGEGAAGATGRLGRLFNPSRLTGHEIEPIDEPVSIDESLLADMMQPTGNFGRAFPDYEFRPQQLEMLAAVTEAFNTGHHLLVEAGTGTGKSVGYLLPAAFWAVENGRRVVVSTNTINLQDQLLTKDIPTLQRILPFELRAALRKGRRNYVCTRLFRQMRHTGPANADEMVLYARLLIWLPTTDSGDVAEINLRRPGERMAWSRLSGENATCRPEDCAAERCPLHIARRRAELAHIVVVNHALLLSDVANNNHILPPFNDLIIDEAHHLESAVTNGLSFEADKRYLTVIIEEITKPRAGLVAELQSRTDGLPETVNAIIRGYIERLRQAANKALIRLDEFFATLDYFVSQQTNARSQFSQEIRLTSAMRAQPYFDEVMLSWENLNHNLEAIVAGFAELAGGVADLNAAMPLEDGDDLEAALNSHGRSLEETRRQLDQLLIEPQEGIIYWIEKWRDRSALHAAPLHVGPLVEKHVFQEKETTILTSATLRTAAAGRSQGESSFDYIRGRLHAWDAYELAVGSPFDYENRTLLYLCSDIPEPNQPGYQRYVEDAIIDVATALGGRTMVLFTSYGQLTQTAQSIEGALTEAGITLLAQMQGASRQQLLTQFKRPEARAVLLGTRSFWEGVDVPGEALQAVMIAKIPFDVPSDPIFAARSETFNNAFFEYAIPEAVLRFRQGFGRLNRRQADEGVVVVLDKRVLTKRYGQAFIEALPPCTVLRQRTARLGELTQRWLNRDR